LSVPLRRRVLGVALSMTPQQRLLRTIRGNG
jgi:hypothetical protein